MARLLSFSFLVICFLGWWGRPIPAGATPSEARQDAVEVVFANDDGQNIHILGPGEDFRSGDPPGGNRLTSGASRLFVTSASVGDDILFRAGRNGTVLATTTCTYQGLDSDPPRVVWDGAALDCEDWEVGPTPTSLEVNTTTDETDHDVEDGTCDVDPNDTGDQCTLRAALEIINHDATENGRDEQREIVFDMPDPVIDLAGSLPEVVASVLLRGTTQEDGFVELDGRGVGGDGLHLKDNASDSRVEGFVIHSVGGDGIELNGVAGVTVAESTIGRMQDETAAGVGGHGIYVNQATDATIGGAGASNTIWNSGQSGIFIRSGEGNRILNNNIALNGDGGVVVESGTQNRILGNSINMNGGLGIDLEDDGVTENDGGDGDTGANRRQNYPVLTAQPGGAFEVFIDGSVDDPYTIELFGSDACDESGYGEGTTPLHIEEVTTDGSGEATFVFTPSASLAAYSATATDEAGNTSEFGPCVEPLMPLTGTVTILGSNPPMPLFFAHVTATDDEGQAHTARTNEQGIYELNLEPGTYQFTVAPKPEDANIRVPIQQQVIIDADNPELPDVQMGVANRFEQTVLLTAGLETYGRPQVLGFDLPGLLFHPYQQVMLDIDDFAVAFPDPPVATDERLYRLHLGLRATDQLADGAKDLGADFNGLFIDMIASIVNLGALNERFRVGLAKIMQKFNTFTIRGTAIEVVKLRRLTRTMGGRVGKLVERMRNGLVSALKSMVAVPTSDGGEVPVAPATAAVRKTIELFAADYLTSRYKPEDVVKGVPANFGTEFFASYYGGMTEGTVRSALTTARTFSPANDDLNLDQAVVNSTIAASVEANRQTVERITTSYRAVGRDLTGQIGGAAESTATIISPLLFVPGLNALVVMMQEVLGKVAAVLKGTETVLKVVDFADIGHRVFIQTPTELDAAMARAYGRGTLQAPAPTVAQKQQAVAALQPALARQAQAAAAYDEALLAIQQHVLADDFNAYVDAIIETLGDADADLDGVLRSVEGPVQVAAAATIAQDSTYLASYGAYVADAYAFDANRVLLYYDLLAFLFEAATFDDVNDPAYVARRDSLFATMDAVMQQNAHLSTQLDDLVIGAGQTGTVTGTVVIESVLITTGIETLLNIPASPQSFLVTATIRNLSDQAVSSVEAFIPELDPALGLALTSAQHVALSIPPEGTQEVQWEMMYSGSLLQQAAPFSISLLSTANKAANGLQVADDFRVTVPISDEQDTDEDGLPDSYEQAFRLDMNTPDADSDADNDDLLNLAEFFIGTDPQNADSDGDGFVDGAEIEAASNALDASKTPEGDVNVQTEDIDEVPSSFALAQNYPNPFNPETTISFTLPQQTHVRLSVYNVLGREVARLVDAVRPPGTHIVRFDAGTLPSGVYVYRMHAGPYIQARSMILLR